MIKRGAGVAGVVGSLLVAAVPGAGATPRRDVFPLVCDNGATYSVSFNEQGTWSALHDTASTAAIIPVVFGDISMTVYDAAGNVDRSLTYPGQVKRGAHTADANCTFSFSQVSDGAGPDPAGYSLFVTGTLSIRATPAS